MDDGTVFDSSRAKNRPYEFVIGVGAVIKGWDEAVVQMTLGQRCLMVMTPDYGYGSKGAPPAIPPDAVLHFDLELLQINDLKPKKVRMIYVLFFCESSRYILRRDVFFSTFLYTCIVYHIVKYSRLMIWKMYY